MSENHQDIIPTEHIMEQILYHYAHETAYRNRILP